MHKLNSKTHDCEDDNGLSKWLSAMAPNCRRSAKVLQGQPVLSVEGSKRKPRVHPHCLRPTVQHNESSGWITCWSASCCCLCFSLWSQSVQLAL